MKRLLLVLLFCLVALPAWAQPDMIWYSPAQYGEFKWTVVTTLADDVPVPEGSSIVYDVFRSPHPIVGDRHDELAQEMIGRTTDAQYRVDFISEGNWVVGVQSVRIDDATGDVMSRSETISWTDDATVCMSEIIFGWFYYIFPSAAVDLERVEP